MIPHSKRKKMKIKELTEYLDSIFLPVYQEEYDNAGFLVGDPDDELAGVLTTTDVTDAVIDEAIGYHLNLIVSHHPLIFGGLKRITPTSDTSRMVMKLIENHISVYTAHTNLDNQRNGVNGILAMKLGLQDCRILRPAESVLRKLVTYVPLTDADKVRHALFDAGAGGIGAYDCCSWNAEGTGTFRAHEGCHPHCGEIGELHHENEIRIEVVYEQRIERQLLSALRKTHPYEEPAIDCIPLANKYEAIGAGMVGVLPSPVAATEFLAEIKRTLGIPIIRSSETTCNLAKRSVRKIAICGGSGSFLIGDAKACGADIFMTSDLKYHDFQSAGESLILTDIGHYESEQFAKEIFYREISQKFSNFACRISEEDVGFINYI